MLKLQHLYFLSLPPSLSLSLSLLLSISLYHCNPSKFFSSFNFDGFGWAKNWGICNLHKKKFLIYEDFFLIIWRRLTYLPQNASRALKPLLFLFKWNLKLEGVALFLCGTPRRGALKLWDIYLMCSYPAGLPSTKYNLT